MEKHKYVGKTKEEAINIAKLDLQETENNLIIIEKEEIKGGLFKSKKIEIEVIEKREIIKFLKEYIQGLLKDLGFSINIEVKLKEEVPNYIIYSDNDALLIGKGGKNLHAFSTVVGQALKKELSVPFKFSIDVSDYKEHHQKQIELLAKRVAREVASSKIEVKMDSMNSYERRIVHNTLANNKMVYTESVGEEPNRAVVIKSRED